MVALSLVNAAVPRSASLQGSLAWRTQDARERSARRLIGGQGKISENEVFTWIIGASLRKLRTCWSVRRYRHDALGRSREDNL
jgi:hypothetical protein